MFTSRAATALAVIAVLSLTGCATVQPDPVRATTPTSQPTPAAPTSSPEATQPPVKLSLPSDCRDLVTPDIYEATFGDTPLNDPQLGGRDLGAVEPSPAPAGADLYVVMESATQLRCLWRHPSADISGLEARVGTVDRLVAAQHLAELASEGHTCQAMLGGERCQLIGTDETYGVGVGHTTFLRDDIYIHIWQGNFPTSNLLGSIVEKLWE